MLVAGLAGLRGCAKPGCASGAPLNRHHIRHEALWLSAWAHRQADPRFRSFVERYYEYRTEDCCTVCIYHHAEIHHAYDRVIAEDIARRGLPLYLYDWKQARALMDKLQQRFHTWILEETPGLDNEEYERMKPAYRKRLAREARRRFPPTAQSRELLRRRRRALRATKKRRRRR